MTKRFHDWIKYKQDYFDSDIAEVVNFFATFNPPITKNQFGKRIKGWKEEKQRYKKQQADAAREKAANDPEIKDLTVQIIRGKANALKIIVAKLVKEKDELSMKDLGIAVDLLRRELGEVGTISENKNENKNEHTLGEDFKRLVDEYVGQIKSKKNADPKKG